MKNRKLKDFNSDFMTNSLLPTPAPASSRMCQQYSRHVHMVVPLLPQNQDILDNLQKLEKWNKMLSIEVCSLSD